MNRNEFNKALRRGLSSLSHEDIEAQVSFYNEMIDDRMEEGLSEEEAVAQIGSVEQIIGHAILDEPVKQKHTLGALEIVLLVLGSPVWLSLLIAAFALVLSLYTVLWSVVVSLWAVEGSVLGCAFAGFVVPIAYMFDGHPLNALAFLGFSLFCAGMSIFGFYGCKSLTKACAFLSKKAFTLIKSLFVRKEAA